MRGQRREGGIEKIEEVTDCVEEKRRDKGLLGLGRKRKERKEYSKANSF